MRDNSDRGTKNMLRLRIDESKDVSLGELSVLCVRTCKCKETRHDVLGLSLTRTSGGCSFLTFTVGVGGQQAMEHIQETHLQETA